MFASKAIGLSRRLDLGFNFYTRKYMHAATPRLADKTIVFSEHEVSLK